MKTVKELSLRAGNECAFPGCTTPLITESGVVLGEVCHICSDKPGGPRYDSTQNDSERQGSINLILFCPTHHTLVDSDDTTYTADLLREMKRRHESKAHKRFTIDDGQATRIAILLLGGSATTDLIALAKELYASLSTNVSPDNPQTALQESLRYGPKGALAYFSEDDVHVRFGDLLCTIFGPAGWRVERLANKPSDLLRVDFTKGMLCRFTISDKHQIVNAAKAVHDVFDKLGFVPSHGGDKYDGADEKEGKRITIYPRFTFRR
jgi:hypothetical protein